MIFSPLIRKIILDLKKSGLPPVDQRDYNPQGKMRGERGGRFDPIQPGTAHYNINKSRKTLLTAFQRHARKNGTSGGVSEALDYLMKESNTPEEINHIAQVAKIKLGKDLGPIIKPTDKPVTVKRKPKPKNMPLPVTEIQPNTDIAPHTNPNTVSQANKISKYIAASDKRISDFVDDPENRDLGARTFVERSTCASLTDYESMIAQLKVNLKYHNKDPTWVKVWEESLIKRIADRDYQIAAEIELDDSITGTINDKCKPPIMAPILRDINNKFNNLSFASLYKKYKEIGYITGEAGDGPEFKQDYMDEHFYSKLMKLDEGKELDNLREQYPEIQRSAIAAWQKKMGIEITPDMAGVDLVREHMIITDQFFDLMDKTNKGLLDTLTKYRSDNPCNIQVTIVSDEKGTQQQQTELKQTIHTLQSLIGERYSQFKVNLQYEPESEGRSGYNTRTNTIIIRGKRIGATAHEFGHALEYNFPEIGKRSVEYLNKRTKGESLIPMSDIKYISLWGDELNSCMEGYKDDEKTRPDNFHHPYCGKTYTPDSLGHQATEILSTGLECLTSNATMLYNRDRDYFEFIVKTLRGQE